MVETVVIRSMEKSDLKIMHAWLNDPRAFGPYDEAGFSSAERVLSKWEAGGYSTTLIIDCDGESIGFCNYIPSPWEDWIAVVGVIIASPSYRGRGLGTQVHEQLVQFIFERHPSVEKIEAYTDVENRAEQRALEKSGFLREGVLRKKNRLRSDLRDMCLYGIIREDYAP